MKICSGGGDEVEVEVEVGVQHLVLRLAGRY